MKKLLLILLLCALPAFADITDQTNWRCVHDAGTQGTSTATTALVPTPSLDGQSRQFVVSWTDYGGERCSVSITKDATTTAFRYDVHVLMNDLSHVHILELDHNQVTENGETIIYGSQCNFAKGIWQYTTKVNGKTHWNDSNLQCSRWAPGWHHIQIRFHRIGPVVTYDSVAIDGVKKKFIGASGVSSFDLNWPVGVQVVNFQIDGDVAGGTTAYADSLEIQVQTAPPTQLSAAAH